MSEVMSSEEIRRRESTVQSLHSIASSLKAIKKFMYLKEAHASGYITESAYKQALTILMNEEGMIKKNGKDGKDNKSGNEF